jgi:hypothetical protein
MWTEWKEVRCIYTPLIRAFTNEAKRSLKRKNTRCPILQPFLI